MPHPYRPSGPEFPSKARPNHVISRSAIHPNPANDVVNFSIQPPVGRSLEVTVTDMLGRQFPLLKGVSRNETGDSVINLNTSALPNGIYLLTITDHNGNSYTERLVVQH